MVQKKTRKIFNEKELYTFCLAEICGISVKEETGYSSNWADFIDEELEKKYNKLSSKGQDGFDRRLTKVAIKYRDDFESLQREIKNQEEYIELEEEKNELMYKVADELKEFLKV